MPTLDRATLLAHPDALDCTLYRPSEREGDEERDLGDGKILFTGPFQAPAEWDAAEREDYFDGTPEADFLTARIAADAAPGHSAHFTAEPGDYAAVVERNGKISMFYVYDQPQADGPLVLIREEELL